MTEIGEEQERISSLGEELKGCWSEMMHTADFDNFGLEKDAHSFGQDEYPCCSKTAKKFYKEPLKLWIFGLR